MTDSEIKNSCSSPVRKRCRTEDDSNDQDHPEVLGEYADDFLTTFKDFEVVRIINNNGERKSLVAECRIKDKDGVALVQLEKQPFSEEKLGEVLSSNTNLRTLFDNDIYYNRTALLPPELNEIKATITYPALKKHIQRFEVLQSSFIDETPQLYEEVTKVFINTSAFNKDWIYNILDHKKEADRIVFEDPDPETGFLLLPDLKWTGEQTENLHLQAIVHRRDISCLRDLNTSHLPLLRNLQEKGKAAIMEKYGIPGHKLRVYFHYVPSFYHLHVHFTSLSHEAPGTWAGKAHLLSAVISNIEACADYYQRATLSFTLKDNTPLSNMFKDKGYFIT